MSSEGWAYIVVKPVGDARLSLKTDKWSIRGAKHSIGRNPTSDTVLDGYAVVSANHCVITTDFTAVLANPTNGTPSQTSFAYLRAQLMDTSTNGTVVNGTLLRKGESCPLQDGAKIEMKGKKVPLVLEFHLVLLSEKEIAALRLASQTSPSHNTPVRSFPRSSSNTPNSIVPKQPTPANISNGKPDLNESESEVIFLRQRVRELETALQAKIASREDSLDQDVRESNRLQEIVTKLHQELDVREARLREVEKEKERAQSLADQTLREAKLLEQQLENERDRARKFEHEENYQSNHRLELERVWNEQLNEMKTKYETEIEQLSEREHVLAATNSDLETRNKELRGEIDSIIKDLEEKLVEKEQKMTAAQMEVLRTEREFEALNKTYTSVTNELIELKVRYSSNLAAKEKEIEELKLQMKQDLDAQHATVTAQVTQLAAKVEAANKAKSKMEKELSTAVQTQVDLRAELSRAIQSHTKEATELKSGLAVQTEKANMLEEQATLLQNNVRELSAQTATLEDNAKRAKRTSDAELAELRKTIKNLSTNLTKTQYQHDEEVAKNMSLQARVNDAYTGLDTVRRQLTSKLESLKSITREQTGTTTTTVTSTERETNEEEEQSTPSRRRHLQVDSNGSQSRKRPVKRMRQDEDRALTEEDSGNEAKEADDEVRSLPEQINTQDVQPAQPASDSAQTTMNNLATQASGNASHQRIPSANFFEQME